MSNHPVKVVAFYKFFEPACDLNPLREALLANMHRLELRGTILLSKEGINAALAGSPQKLDEFVGFLSEKIGISDWVLKTSYTENMPFNRALVKLKPYIVAEPGKTHIDLIKTPAPHLAPEELHRWIQSGKRMILLDTRNDYEYELGKFAGAQHLGTENFAGFEEDLKKTPEAWKNLPVVTFCTGGIRCEKAAPLMLQKGFREVYQLDGGILNYFEKVGRGFFEGGCFVFDKRVALDEKLQPTGDVMCFACQAILKPEDANSPEFKEGISCPKCFKSKKHAEIHEDLES